MHARLIAQLWLCGGDVGGTGTLSFRGFETSDAGWIVRADPPSRVRLMTKAEKRIADAAREMTTLKQAIAELAAQASPARAPRATTAELVSAIAKGKQKDRAAALAKLASVDPVAAERIVLEWLADVSWWEDPQTYALPPAAFEAGATIGTKRCIARMVAVYLEVGGGWSMTILAKARSADAASTIASALTAESLRDHVAQTTDLLRILKDRREIGDRSRIEAIARDVKRLVATCDLPAISKADWVKRISALTKELLALPS